MGCCNLGLVFDYGKGVESDKSKEVVFYWERCDVGFVWGCISLGYLYVRGFGVLRNFKKVVGLNMYWFDYVILLVYFVIRFKGVIRFQVVVLEKNIF